MKSELKKRLWALSAPLLLLSGAALLLIVVRMIVGGSTRYWFLPWNLLLAWIPFLLAFAVVYAGNTFRWTSWQFVVLFLAWLFFLPNTFYIVTDLIHIHSTGEVGILYDAVMMTMFIVPGLLMGFASLSMIEKELRRGLGRRTVQAAVLAIILLSSFAIYLGRYLRWNSWDVLLNPGGLLLDTADHVFRPYDHPLGFTTTLLFAVMITSVYYGFKLFARAAKKLD